MILIKLANKRINICVDIDGVLNQLYLAIAHIIHREFNINVDISQYDLFRQISLTPDEKNNFYNKFQDEIDKKTKPEWRCQQYLYELKKQYRICITTARPNILRESTLLWLYNHNIPYDKIFFNCGQKVDICKKLKSKYIIEDSPWNVNALGMNKINTLIFSRPYNLQIKNNKYITRVYNWQDIYNIILGEGDI